MVEVWGKGRYGWGGLGKWQVWLGRLGVGGCMVGEAWA